jgi:hypothetical protein
MLRSRCLLIGVAVAAFGLPIAVTGWDVAEMVPLHPAVPAPKAVPVPPTSASCGYCVSRPVTTRPLPPRDIDADRVSTGQPARPAPTRTEQHPPPVVAAPTVRQRVPTSPVLPEPPPTAHLPLPPVIPIPTELAGPCPTTTPSQREKSPATS